MSPEVLVDSGAGEFVVTLHGAYHSRFSHGEWPKLASMEISPFYVAESNAEQCLTRLHMVAESVAINTIFSMGITMAIGQ